MLAGEPASRQRQERRPEPYRAGDPRIMLGWRSATGLVLTCALQAVGLEAPHPAFAWGVEGHEIIALIAERYLDPAVRAKVAALLAADTDTLTDHDISSEATWGGQVSGQRSQHDQGPL